MDRYLDTHLDHRAHLTPGKDAFVIGQERLSYADLATKSDRLSRQLSHLGVGPGSRVGIFMDKCLDMPVAVYGILKSGAAYVPLDAAAPSARTAGIVEDCSISVIVTQASKAARLEEVVSKTTCLGQIIGADVEGADCTSIDTDAPAPERAPERTPDDHAYILFTSGSTGAPKGMVHTHASGLAYMDMTVALFGLTDQDRMANQSPLHFDMAMLEFFSGISVGATVVMIPEVLTKLPASLSQLMEDAQVTTWYSVPFALIQLAEYGVIDQRDLTRLRWVIFGGAPMSNRHLRQLQTLLPGARFSNSYGPAEANQVTFHHLAPAPHSLHDPVPIGQPCDHTQIKITETGELLIASTAMMEGYWNRDDLNADAFVHLDGQRYYRTGDVVRQAPDGSLQYLGRQDRQVKIRGFRIELDEVELALSTHPALFEVAVQVAKDGLTLEAFVTCVAGQTTTPEDLSAHLRDLLPAPYIPSKIEILDAFERTATGKINREALRKTA